ncbi:MAG TPA: Sec-independent protein translocase protein TatB [Dongiaceae bacterium]|jgi:sec-independent protein translocase protein TatB|nr:Sec-independent protein translocase protein TatB [Dongiaceae bacterium]
MFDIGWSELAIIAVVALVVLGPKELPNALRLLAQVMRYGRKMASDLQSGFNELVREAELEETRAKMRDLSPHSIANTLEKHLDPTGEIKQAMIVPPQDDKADPT